MYSTSTNYKNKILADSTQHLLKIYIDDNKIEDRYILECKISSVLLENDEFSFGTTPARTVNLKIHKNALPDTYERFYIESGITGEVVPIGYFNVDEISKDDDYTVSLTLIDDMSKFEFNYDGSSLTYPVTLMQVLQDICSKAGVELGSTSFLNSNKQIAVYDSTVTARTYLGYISEQAGSFAVIGRDGKLYIKSIGEDAAELDLRYFSKYSWGEEFKVSRIAYEDGIQDFKQGDETNNTIWINSDNMYIVDKEQIINIYNEYKDFDVYSFSGTSIVDPAWDIGDLITIDGRKVMYQGDLEYKGKFKASISSNIQAKTKEETTATKISEATKIRRVQSQIDQVEGTITQLVEENSEQSQKLSQVEQTIDEISQKVEDVEDLTNTVEGNTNITLENCIEGNLLELHIYGNNMVFDYLYPRNDLYPSDDLYPHGDSMIEVTDNDGNSKIYDLGITEVLRQNGEICDEYVWQDNKASIIRRINEDGTVKEKEEVEELGNFEIKLSEGNNVIKIKNYEARLSARCIVKNDYTDVFATKVEMNSAITQTAESIASEVNKKVGEDELGTKIIQDYESVQIAWNKISEFIQFINAQLQIKNDSKNLLMALDKLGMHFYDSTGKQIGDVGLIESESEKQIAFAINGDNAGNSMVWGIKKTSNGQSTFFPIFRYGDYNTQEGTEYGGLFTLEAPIVMQENTIFLGNGTDENSPQILGTELDGNTGYVTIKTENGFEVRNSSGDIILSINLGYFKFGEIIETGTNIYGEYVVNVLGNVIADNLAQCQDISILSGGFYGNQDGYLLVSQKEGNNYFFLEADTVSDKKVKKNIKTSKLNALEVIKKINHKEYEWKNGKREKVQVGYIAQELEKIDNNLVNVHEIKTDNGTIKDYTLNRTNILSLATKAIQEQQEFIEKQGKLINELQEKVINIEEKLKNYEMDKENSKKANQNSD